MVLTESKLTSSWGESPTIPDRYRAPPDKTFTATQGPSKLGMNFLRGSYLNGRIF